MRETNGIVTGRIDKIMTILKNGPASLTDITKEMCGAEKYYTEYVLEMNKIRYALLVLIKKKKIKMEAVGSSGGYPKKKMYSLVGDGVVVSGSTEKSG